MKEIMNKLNKVIQLGDNFKKQLKELEEMNLPSKEDDVMWLDYLTTDLETILGELEEFETHLQGDE